jgi:hypothetical protein
MSASDPFLRAAAERSAQRAEEAFEFWAAARWYREAARLAADPEQVAFDRLRWARALQKAENWRTQTAGWEELGNAIGREIGVEPASRYESARQRRAVDFGVIDDDEWSNLSYADLAATRRHRQAWAYQWGAEVAITHLEFAFAARRLRRAGVTWEKSEHKDKWRRAATCYYEAAMSAARTSRHHTRRGIHEKGWCPSCLREKGTEQKCTHQGAAATIDGGEGVGTDVQRLRHCWLKEMQDAHGDPERRNCVLPDGARQISAIQTLLATTVSREDARAMFREGHAFRRDCLRAQGSWPALWYSRLGALTWRNGSSLRGLLCTIAVVFLAVIPSLWLLGGAITTHPKVPEAILFSLATMVNTAGDHFPKSGTVTTYFQVLEALSGFIALGLALWVSQRSYA